MDDYYIKIEDKEFGPVTYDDLKDLAREGSFSGDDLVRPESQSDWQEARKLEAFASLFNIGNGNGRHPAILYAIASGKGGVGKSVLTASLGVGFATMGSKIILVDGDFTGANLHTTMGITEPEYTLFDYFTLQKETLDEILLDTLIEDLKMVSGACGSLGLVHDNHASRKSFSEELRNLPAERVFLDLGAGANESNIDFFLLADEQILVTTPEPTAVHEAFGFLKACVLRQLQLRLSDYPAAAKIISGDEINRPGEIEQTIGDLLQKVREVDSEAALEFRSVLDTFNPKLILNMLGTEDDLKETVAIQAAALELLSIDVEILGYISQDQSVPAAVKALKPFLVFNTASRASRDLAALIRVKLLGKKGVKEILERRKWRRAVENFSKKLPKQDLSESTPICSIKCFYWGDCEFQDGGKPCRVRHLDPRFGETLEIKSNGNH